MLISELLESGLEQVAGIGIDGQSFKFKITDLIALANNYPVTKINPKQFEEQLQGREEDPSQSMARAQKAELKYPIIVVKRKNGSLWIADGTHRAHKAIMMDLPTIDAKIIPVDDMDQFLVNEDANSDLAQALKKTQTTSYDAIDSLMKKIAKQYNITAKELHDLWIKKYDQTPDDWIKAKLNESKRQYLDFDKLYGRAFKITDAEGDPNKPGFSIVTPSNTNAWTDWKEKPQFKNIVKQRLNDPNFLGDHKYLQIIDAMSQISEGPIWDKVKKTAAAGAVAGAAGYGALTGQFSKDEPARAPTEITIPGGDLEQQKPAVKKEKEKLTPSTATNADPKMEQLVFVTALRSGIKGKELAQFMAQVAHETLGFQRLVEVGNKEYFNRYDPEHNPKKAKILGNVKKGDGLRYKGRGFIQITGRDNYNRAGQALGIDLVNNPKLASNPEVAAKIAVWYWKSRVKPAVDDYTDTIGVTSKVNPSMNGLGDRDMNFQHYLQRLDLNENFADGKNPGRKGLAKRSGVNCKQSVTKLRKVASNSTGEKQRMAHWCANMKGGKK
jgi:predicted chitinase